MKKEELEEKVLELTYDAKLANAIKVRCIAFWSGVITVFGMFGSWASNHSKPVAAAWNAFWSNYP